SQRPLQLTRAMELLVDRALGKAPAHAPQQLSVQQEAHGKVTGLWLQGPIDRKARSKRLTDGLEGTAGAVHPGVSEVAPDGVPRVAELLANPDADVYLARVPLSVASMLDEDAVAAARGRVVSVLVQASCGRCGPVDVELDPAELRRHLTGGPLE